MIPIFSCTPATLKTHSSSNEKKIDKIYSLFLQSRQSRKKPQNSYLLGTLLPTQSWPWKKWLCEVTYTRQIPSLNMFKKYKVNRESSTDWLKVIFLCSHFLDLSDEQETFSVLLVQ